MRWNVVNESQHSIRSTEKENTYMKSILIKDTTRDERIRIVQLSLNVCGTECEFCNGCDNLGGGIVDNLYQPLLTEKKRFLKSMGNIEESL